MTQSPLTESWHAWTGQPRPTPYGVNSLLALTAEYLDSKPSLDHLRGCFASPGTPGSG